MIPKIQKIVFILLLIFLPSQLGFHFWPEWSYINGVRIDYFSPTLYFTDFLVLVIFLLELPRLKIKLSSIRLIGLISLMGFISLNIYFSFSPFVSFYKWLKIAELTFLAWFVAKNLRHSFKRPLIIVMLLIPIAYSCILAVWQFLSQGSVGGVWYWLGERAFNNSTPGIANAVINGQLVLRPYATFSHPNALAGFLLVAGSLVVLNIPHISRKITAGVLALILLVVFLTLSRGSLLSGWQLRQQLNNIAIQQFSNSPLVGTGLGTSPLYGRNISNYAMLHQPIHNIYLLVLSETGVVGLIGLISLICYLWQRGKGRILLCLILALGFFDHYWLTLQQPQLLFALILGIMWR